jgi:hypothetical protein
VGTTTDLEYARTVYLKNTFANSETFTMRKLHVTHEIFESEQEAQTRANELNNTYLPFDVTITGFTID